VRRSNQKAEKSYIFAFYVFFSIFEVGGEALTREPTPTVQQKTILASKILIIG